MFHRIRVYGVYVLWLRNILLFYTLQSRTKLLENFYPTMHTIQRNNTISTTTDLRYQIPLPPGQCCFLQMSKDQGCFRTHNNIAPKGRGEGGTQYSENVSKNGLGIWHFLNSFVQDCSYVLIERVRLVIQSECGICIRILISQTMTRIASVKPFTFVSLP